MVGLLVLLLLVILPLAERLAVILACIYLIKACQVYVGPSGSPTFMEKVKAAYKIFNPPKGVQPVCKMEKGSSPTG